MEDFSKARSPGSIFPETHRPAGYVYQGGTKRNATMMRALNPELAEPFSFSGIPLSDIFPIDFVDGRYKLRDGWNDRAMHENAIYDHFRGVTRVGFNVDNIVIDDPEALVMGEDGNYEVSMTCNLNKGTFTTSYYPIKSLCYCLYQLMDLRRWTGVQIPNSTLATDEAVADTLLMQICFSPLRGQIKSTFKLDMHTVLRMVMHFVYYFHNYETSDVSYALKRAPLTQDILDNLEDAVAVPIYGGIRAVCSTGVRVNHVSYKLAPGTVETFKNAISEAGYNSDVYRRLSSPAICFAGTMGTPGDESDDPDSTAVLHVPYVTFNTVSAANALVNDRRKFMIYDQWRTNVMNNQTNFDLNDPSGDNQKVNIVGEIGNLVYDEDSVYQNFVYINKVGNILGWEYCPELIIEGSVEIISGNDDDPYHVAAIRPDFDSVKMTFDTDTKEVHFSKWPLLIGEASNYFFPVISSDGVKHQSLMNKYKSILGDGIVRMLTATKLSEDDVAGILDLCSSSDFSEIDPLMLKQVVSEQNSYKMNVSSVITAAVRRIIALLATSAERADQEGTIHVLRLMSEEKLSCDPVMYQRHVERWPLDLVGSSECALSLRIIAERYIYPMYCNALGTSNGTFQDWVMHLFYAVNETSDVENDETLINLKSIIGEVDAEYISTVVSSFSETLELSVDDIIASVDVEDLNTSDVIQHVQERANSFIASLDAASVKGVVETLRDDDAVMMQMVEKIRSSCSTSVSEVVSSVPEYVRAVKDNTANFSFSVQRFLNKATKIRNPLELVYNSNNAKQASDLGWSSNEMYSDASKMDLAIGAIPADTLVAGCIVAAKAVEKATIWVRDKVRNFVNEKLKDGASVRINKSGFATINVQACSQLYTLEEFNAFYPNLAAILRSQQGNVDSTYCVCQFGPMYMFFQTVGNSVLLTCNPKVNKKRLDQSLAGNDYTFLRQLAESVVDNQKFNNAMINLLLARGIISEDYAAAMLLDIESVDDIMVDITNRASSMTKWHKQLRYRADGWLCMLAGAAMMLGPYSWSRNSDAMRAMSVGSAMAFGEIPMDATAQDLAKLHGDTGYANDIVKSTDFISILQNGISLTQLEFALQALNLLANFKYVEDDFPTHSLVHNGTGYVYNDIGDYTANNIPLGFIPMVTFSGSPSFLYSLVTDEDRLASFASGVAVVGSLAIAAIVAVVGITMKVAATKKYDKLNAQLWAGTSDANSTAFKNALKQVKKTRRLEKFLFNSPSGDTSSFSLSSLFQHDEMTDSKEELKGIISQLNDIVATKDDVEDANFSSALTDVVNQYVASPAVRSRIALGDVNTNVSGILTTSGVVFLVTALLSIINKNQEIDSEVDSLIEKDSEAGLWNPPGIVK